MDVWNKVLSSLGKRVSKQCFDTWFRPIVFQGRDENGLHLRVPNENFKKWLLENYAEALREAVTEAAHKPIPIEVSVEGTGTSKPILPPEATDKDQSPSLLNPKYTFESFVVGTSNQFARAAAWAVAERPSKAYNPLYIYGGVGLGKTHLMHAIGHFILQKNSHLRVNYMSSERFMNE